MLVVGQKCGIPFDLEDESCLGYSNQYVLQAPVDRADRQNRRASNSISKSRSINPTLWTSIQSGLNPTLLFPALSQ